MSDQLNEFAKQIEIFREIINKSLAQVPELSSFELGTLTILPKEELEETAHTRKSNDKGVFSDTHGPVSALRPRICNKPGQKPHPYYGSYPCPDHGY